MKKEIPAGWLTPTQGCCWTSFNSTLLPYSLFPATRCYLKFNPTFLLCLFAFIFLGVVIGGCGSVSSHPGPTPTPTPGTTPSPTPGPSPSPTPTPGPSSAAITGRVLDPSGAPVHGTVIVSLERGPGDFSVVKQTNADAQGNFRFDNVPAVPAGQETYAIVVAARNVPGDFYTPAILLPGGGNFGAGDPIVPGTNVGTIGLRFTTQGDIEGNVTSTDSTQKVPVPIHVSFGLLGIFTRDFVFRYPLIPAPTSFDTATGSTCPAGTACAAYQLSTVPTDPAEEAVFNRNGYTFAPTQSGASFSIRLDATSQLNGKPTCNPQELEVGANGLKADSPNQAGDAHFLSCQ